MADLLDTSSGANTPTGTLPPSYTGGYDPNQLSPMDFFLQSVPGYNFAFEQGQRGVQSQAAASGTLLTGGTLKKLARYGAGTADQHYGDTVNRYLSLANLGLRSATAPFA